MRGLDKGSSFISVCIKMNSMKQWQHSVCVRIIERLERTEPCRNPVAKVYEVERPLYILALNERRIGGIEVLLKT